MSELTMENTYMKHPYKGSELGFIFEKESEALGNKGEVLHKGRMTILDPDLKLRDLIEGLSPDRLPRRYLKMSNLVCIQEDKINDAYHIVHTFIHNMRPIEEQIERNGKLVVVTNKLY
jgi:hypothetical protein